MRFLIVEDDRETAERLARWLSPHGPAHICPTIRGARRAEPASGQWDALLIDVRLPDGSGLDLLRSIRAAGCVTPVLVITGLATRRRAQEAQLHQAMFLPKRARRENVEAFVGWVQMTRQLDAPSVFRTVDSIAESHGLGAQQREILFHRARGLRRSEIARAMGLNENTIKSHVNAILRKTGHRRLVHLLQSSRRRKASPFKG
jgi:DNA-binding NarL/FixJ family response regulator